MAFCTGCGKELKPGVRFCTACGKPVPAATPVPTPTPQPPKKKKSKALPIILISLIALLLAGAAIWWFLLRDTDDADEDDRKEKTEQAETGKEAVFAEDVTFDFKHADGEEYAVITGYDEDDKDLWTVTTDRYPISQLDSVQEIGLCNDCYCYIEDGSIVALSLLDGTELWRNTEFNGALGDFVLAENGALYLCGYFGPDLFIVNKDGKTVDRIASLKEGFIWPYDIRFDGDGNLRITYEQVGEDGGEGAITLNPETLEILAVEGEAAAEPETPRNIALAASSTLQETGYNHSPYLAMDGNNATAWVEGANGNGEGEWLRLDLGSDCHVSGMQLWTGYQKSESLFYKNSRPSRVRVTFSDGTSLEADLADTMSMQTISFGGDHMTSTITITILSVYPGTAYTDTCISEITLS